MYQDLKFIDRPSPNYWYDPRPIKAVVLHGTASNNIEAAISWHQSKKSEVSANFHIDKAGRKYRVVDPVAGKKAWGNGVVEIPDLSIAWLQQAIKDKVNINLLTWSIEHEATSDEMRWHRSMTDAQFTSSVELTANLLRLAGLKASHETVLGHCQISSIQKATCPGVIFVPAYVEQLWLRYPDLKP